MTTRQRGTVRYADGPHPAERQLDGSVIAAERKLDGPYVAWRKVNSRIAATFEPDRLIFGDGTTLPAGA